MKLKEAQMLGILALIAVGIILLCMWGGADEPQGTDTVQPETPSTQDVSFESDVLELFDSLKSRAPEPAQKESPQDEGKEASLEIGGTEVAAAPEPTEESRIRAVIEENAPEEIPLIEKEAVATSDGAAPAPAPKLSKRIIHVVQRGETLSQISQKYYGTSRKWNMIVAANKSVLSDPNRLRPDMKLTIPPIEGATVAISSRPALSASSASAARTYTVQKGDTLFRIAMKCYEDGTKWNDILKANEGRISDPKRDVQPGMTLVIP